MSFTEAQPTCFKPGTDQVIKENGVDVRRVGFADEDTVRLIDADAEPFVTGFCNEEECPTSPRHLEHKNCVTPSLVPGYPTPPFNKNAPLVEQLGQETPEGQIMVTEEMRTEMKSTGANTMNPHGLPSANEREIYKTDYPHDNTNPANIGANHPITYDIWNFGRSDEHGRPILNLTHNAMKNGANQDPWTPTTPQMAKKASREVGDIVYGDGIPYVDQVTRGLGTPFVHDTVLARNDNPTQTTVGNQSQHSNLPVQNNLTTETNNSTQSNGLVDSNSSIPTNAPSQSHLSVQNNFSTQTDASTHSNISDSGNVSSPGETAKDLYHTVPLNAKRKRGPQSDGTDIDETETRTVNRPTTPTRIGLLRRRAERAFEITCNVLRDLGYEIVRATKTTLEFARNIVPACKRQIRRWFPEDRPPAPSDSTSQQDTTNPHQPVQSTPTSELQNNASTEHHAADSSTPASNPQPDENWPGSDIPSWVQPSPPSSDCESTDTEMGTISPKSKSKGPFGSRLGKAFRKLNSVPGGWEVKEPDTEHGKAIKKRMIRDSRNYHHRVKKLTKKRNSRRLVRDTSLGRELSKPPTLSDLVMIGYDEEQLSKKEHKRNDPKLAAPTSPPIFDKYSWLIPEDLEGLHFAYKELLQDPAVKARVLKHMASYRRPVPVEEDAAAVSNQLARELQARANEVIPPPITLVPPSERSPLPPPTKHSAPEQDLPPVSLTNKGPLGEFGELKESLDEPASTSASEPAVLPKLVVPLSEEYKAKVHDVLHNSNPNTTVGQGVTRRDIGTIIPTAGYDRQYGWLNDVVIEAYLNLVAQEAINRHPADDTNGAQDATPLFHVFNPALMKSVKEKGVQSVARWARRAKLGGEKLFKAKTLFIPINLTGAHWSLLMIHPQARQIHSLDSLSPGGDQLAIKLAKDWLKAELGSRYVAQEWEVLRTSSTQQTNGKDCGVFACINALAYVRGAPYAGVQAEDMEEARRMMVAALVEGRLEGLSA